jgi:hypothetical protein
MNHELMAAKQAFEAAEANYQKMLNDAKTEQISKIKSYMEIVGVTFDDLKGVTRDGIYKDSNGNEHIYLTKRGKKPSWFKDAVFVRELPEQF